MNYQKIYDQIIDRARDRQLDCYKEKHHVTPKCLGGSNSKSNLVELTAREHFICHLLLVEIYSGNSKLQHAAWAMANQTQNKNQERGYRVSGRLYERLKLVAAASMSKLFKGKLLTQDHRSKMAATRAGQIKGDYKPKELKFEHTCESCKKHYKSADVKGRYCKECKQPRECKCGCGTTVKTVGKEFAKGCQVRGKSYEEIYKSQNPKNGFKKGNKFGKVE